MIPLTVPEIARLLAVGLPCRTRPVTRPLASLATPAPGLLTLVSPAHLAKPRQRPAHLAICAAVDPGGSQVWPATGLLADGAIDALAEQVEMAAMAGGLLDHVRQRIAQAERHPGSACLVIE